MTMNLYVEAEYQLDGDMYVPLALCESNGVCSIENNTLKIVFYPRGNTIFRGDYSALKEIGFKKFQVVMSLFLDVIWVKFYI